MRKLAVPLFFAALLLLPPPLVSANAAQPTPARFEQAPCPRPLPLELEENHGLVCGFLAVPENRTRAHSPTIKLAVELVSSSGARRAADPVLLVAGGPGEGLSSLLPVLVGRGSLLEPLLADRDWIIMDQRGTGHSQPALDCPELTSLSIPEQLAAVGDDDPTPGRVAAMRECRDRLAAEGVDLTGYNTVESAADIADLRRALNLRWFDMYAESYGTRLALAVVRDHPEGVRRMILDATYPLQTGLNAVLDANYSRALNLVFDRCSADPDCSTAYPELRAVFEDLIVRANADPASIQITNFRTGEPVDVAVDGKLLMALFFNILYQPAGISALPGIITLFASGQFEVLSLALSFSTKVALPISWGMHFSVQCGEDVATGIQSPSATGSVLAEVANDFVVPEQDRQICADWPARRTDVLGRTPPRSPIPTLILAGEFDPITPPDYGRLGAESLSNSTFVEFPSLGHTALLSGGACSIGIIQQFLQLPNHEPAPKPETACAASMQLRFITTALD